MRMFDFDDELEEQLAGVLGGHSVEERARRDFHEILRRRTHRRRHDVLGDADNLVRAADALVAEPHKPAVTDAHVDRVASAIESLTHKMDALASRPTTGQQMWSWLTANPWRTAFIAAAGIGVVYAFGQWREKR